MSYESACDLHTIQETIQSSAKPAGLLSPAKPALDHVTSGPLYTQLLTVTTRLPHDRVGNAAPVLLIFAGRSGLTLMLSEPVVGPISPSLTFSVHPFSFCPSGVRGKGVSPVEGSGF